MADDGAKGSVRPRKKGAGRESVLKQKSPAEFFAENKNIAGFDNPGKSLYTTVRELVENSLDAAEAIAELPEISVTIEEISRKDFNSMIGLTHRQRVDEALYDDFETSREQEKRAQKEAREAERVTKAAAAGRKTKESAGSKVAKGRGEALLYRVTVEDNGKGMPHDDIPNMLGKVLSGTKYALKQTRGKYGLGAKMALIWSKMSTGLPIEVWSATEGQSFVSYCRLDMDIQKNLPNVFAHDKQPNPLKWRGVKFELIIEGNWSTYRAKILNYMRQMGVITPYAQFAFKFVGTTPETEVMPPPPQETKYHPSAVDLLLIRQLARESTRQGLTAFLMGEFECIGKGLAERLVEEMGEGFSPKMSVKALTDPQVVRIHQLFRQAKFDNPSGEVFEGHPFVVEAGVSLGGKQVKAGLNIFRFANRIPLLFEPGGDVVTRTAMKRINWSSYKMNVGSDRIGVFCSLVSTKIPFKGTGKEYIGDDVTEIANAVKVALKHCCVQLRAKIIRQQQARERQQRRLNMVKYVGGVSKAVYDVLLSMVESSAEGERAGVFEAGERDVMMGVEKEEITEGVLKQKLMQHVEQVDAEMALEYATATGRSDKPKDLLWVMPLARDQTYQEELHTPVCVFKLFSGV